MRKTIFDKRIPTLFALVLIGAGIGLLTLFVQNHQLLTGNATPSDIPTDIRITNISDTSFTVTYTTQASVIGSVLFGKDKSLGQTALDERDQKSGTLTEHTVHSIVLQNLEPNTSYFFSIRSGTSIYLNNGLPYQTTT